MCMTVRTAGAELGEHLDVAVLSQKSSARADVCRVYRNMVSC
jgi:hypothetical protein